MNKPTDKEIREEMFAWNEEGLKRVDDFFDYDGTELRCFKIADICKELLECRTERDNLRQELDGVLKMINEESLPNQENVCEGDTSTTINDYKCGEHIKEDMCMWTWDFKEVLGYLWFTNCGGQYTRLSHDKKCPNCSKEIKEVSK